MKQSTKIILLLAVFQAAWFAAIIGAAEKMTWPALAGSVVVWSVYVALYQPGSRLTTALLAIALAGWLGDAALSGLGVLRFDPQAAPAPLWLLMLWLNFVTLLDGPLEWLRPRPKLAALLAALGGTSSYALGAEMGALSLGEPVALSLAGLAFEWALLLPALLWLLQRFCPRTRSVS